MTAASCCTLLKTAVGPKSEVGSAAPLQCSAVSGATFLLYWPPLSFMVPPIRLFEYVRRPPSQGCPLPFLKLLPSWQPACISAPNIADLNPHLRCQAFSCRAAQQHHCLGGAGSAGVGEGLCVCVCVYVCVWLWLWLCAACALCGPRVCRHACMWGGRAGVSMRASLCMHGVGGLATNTEITYYRTM